ncbi:MAG: trehalose-6-phosphate synthase [Gammaproteobacteria bacterium]|nr:trehalose-6-phosphate synthase [Gammaproteobacteria bacterium]
MHGKSKKQNGGAADARHKVMNRKGGGRLVVLSNRVAMPRAGQAAPGGLAVALHSALNARGGIWFGWNGRQAAHRPATPQTLSRDGVEYATLPLLRDDFNDYYQGFANQVLWPLMHCRLELLRYRRRYFEAYRRVNAWFAQHLAAMLKPEDTLWVHDYHFVPMAAEVRARGFRGPVGFFLHTPFPPLEILRAMPPHREFLNLFTAYDLVGFQTEGDRHDFVESARRDTGVERSGRYRIHRGPHVLVSGVFPIGVDVHEIADQARRGRHSRQLKTFRRGLEGRRLIIGADRLDYSKGLVERCHAYRNLLSRYPELHRGIVYLQVAEPSRTEVPEYREVRRRLDQIAGEIIGEYARFDWMPMRYLSHRMRRATLLAFLSVASVALVTPLRDGMNLVAKEFIAAQDPDDPGVLILSEMAGAARQLKEALLVNPYDVEGVADAIAEALAMPLPERRRRWEAQFETVRRGDIHNWSDRFLGALNERSATAKGSGA